MLNLIGVGVFVKLDQLLDEFTFGYFVEIGHEDFFFPVSHVYYLFDIPLFLLLVAVHR